MALSEHTGQGPTADDLAQPGFHSSIPSTWKSHKDAERAAKAIEAKAHETRLNMEESVDFTMQKVSDLVSGYLKDRGLTFSFNGPCQVVCKRADGSFFKRSHIGGEDFIFDASYVGKKGKIIFCFNPKAAADYQRIELQEHEAMNLLDKFKSAMDSAMSTGALLAYTEAKKAAALQAERDALASRATQYNDFGAWS